MVLDQKYFENLSFWDKLTRDEKNEIIELSIIKKFEKDNIVHTQEGECLGLVKVINGSIRIYMVSDEGREVTLYNLEQDEVDVLSASCVVNQITFDTQLVAKEETNLLIIPVTILSKYIEQNIYVRSYIYEILADRFSDVMWTMQQILFSKIDQRLASYLIDETNRQGSNVLYVTHEEIAKEISSAREVVARMMKKFSKDGLVDGKRGEIIIKDKNRLLKLI